MIEDRNAYTPSYYRYNRFKRILIIESITIEFNKYLLIESISIKRFNLNFLTLHFKIEKKMKHESTSFY